MKEINNIFLMVSLLASATANAQSTAPLPEEDLLLLYADEEIINIATGTAKPLRLAPSVASVITEKDIKAMGATTLDEALEMVPGLHVSISSNRFNSIYSIRGIHSAFNPQVLLLVNGLPFTDVITGSRPPLFKLPVNNISRIEVIRGPGSAVYGADAFSGVINVITKVSSEIKGTEIGGRIGSFNSHEVWLQHGNQLLGWDTAISVEYSKTDGDDGRTTDSDAQTLNDLAAGTSASLAGQHPFATDYRLFNSSITLSKDHWNVWLNSWNLMSAGVGPGGAQAIDPAGDENVDNYIAKLSYANNFFTEHWGLDANLNFRQGDERAKFRLFPPGAQLPICADGNLPLSPSQGCADASTPNIVTFSEGLFGNPGGELKKTSFEMAFTYHKWNNHLIRIALGAVHEKFSPREKKNFGPGTPAEGLTSNTPLDGTLTDVTGTADAFMTDKTRIVKYLSLQDEWQLAPDWELTGGVRFDTYSDFGHTINPRLALVWATDYNLTTKLLYGRAFRAPSFTELYFDNNPSIIGTADLDPETIDMVELVFDHRATFDLQTVFNIYAYRIRDAIESMDNVFENSEGQRGHGLELDAHWKATRKLHLEGNLAWQRSEHRDSNDDIADAPGKQLTLLARYQASENCSINPQANRVMDRKRATSDARGQVADYTTVDLTLRCNVGYRPLQVAASVRNAFDADAREPSPNAAAAAIPDDYPLAGRSVYIEMSYQFK